MKLPSRLHHTAYTTRNMERTRAFYEEVVEKRIKAAGYKVG